MFRSFLAFVKKEALHILRDPRTLAILFGMPIALVLIFGYTVTNEFRDASLGVVDRARDDLSRELVEQLTASGHFRLVERAASVADLEAAFRSGRIKLGVVIPNGFERDFYGTTPVQVQLLTDASEPNYATTLTSYAAQMIQSFQQRHSAAAAPTPYAIDVELRMVYNPKLVSAYTFIPGVVALILMLISAMMTSLTIAREKEMGTMDLLLISPLPPLLIIVGKVAPYVLLSFLSALIIFAMGYAIFDVPIRGSLLLLLALCLLYLLVALALGVLISTRSATQQAAMLGSLFTLLMPTMLLSGFLFPIASMPVFLQYVARLIPANYFIQIQRAILLKGAGWAAIQSASLVLLVMLLVLLTAAWRNFRVVHK